VTTAGCQYFLEHGSVDMDELALTLAVSRATLYRVISSRDRLLGEVLWRLAAQSLNRARARRHQDGIEGVLDILRCVSNDFLDSKPYRHFITTEPEAATRVLFHPASGLHRRGVEAIKNVFDDAAPAGPWIVEDRDNLAYLLVRITESLCFTELLAGIQPDRDLAERSIRALLVQACTPRQSRTRRALDAVSCLMWTSVPDIVCDGRLTLTALAGL
jgi:hypothetical protein